MLIKGIWTAIVTPMQLDGDVDHQALERLIELQLADGIDGFVVLGTTGEYATLDETERESVLDTVSRVVNGRVPLIMNASANDTRVAIANQRRLAERDDVLATLHVAPWYNKPTQTGLYGHFSAIADSSDKPILLYNVPGRTASDLLAETVCKLAKQHHNIIGIKEATGAIQRSQEIIGLVRQHRQDFSVMSGDDGFILGLLAIGGQGVVSVTSHLCAKELKEMADAFEAGDIQRAQRLSIYVSRFVEPMFFRTSPSPVKAALSMTTMKGRMTPNVRLPLAPLSDEDTVILSNRLRKLGFSI